MAKHLKDTGGTVHCDGVDGNDYALCGFSMDGENGDALMSETPEGIDCCDCIRVIEFCKKLRGGEIKLPFQRRRAL